MARSENVAEDGSTAYRGELRRGSAGLRSGRAKSAFASARVGSRKVRQVVNESAQDQCEESEIDGNADEDDDEDEDEDEDAGEEENQEEQEQEDGTAAIACAAERGEGASYGN
jgi:hypothetical protein